MSTAMITPMEQTNNRQAGVSTGAGMSAGGASPATFTRVQVNGCKVTATIERLGVTMIAKRAKISRNYASLILNGLREPSYQNLQKLAGALSCDYNELVAYLNRQYRARKSFQN